ncbi:MAG: colanic acid biosynthesis acetyltransferase WcaF, partial [Flavobacteriales bacterium]|nr:colanic acid biosynthesis acetyltransferase WcaF [Flavobacteriales bacterium]
MNYQKLDQFKLPHGFRGRSVLIVQLWWLVQSTLFAMSPQFMYGWRVMLLRLFGAKVGEGVIIRPSVRVTYPWKVKVGHHVWIGDHAELY